MNIPVIMKANFLAAVVTVTALLVLGIIYLSFFDFREPPFRVDYTYPTAVARAGGAKSKIMPLLKVKSGGMFYTYREYCITSGYTALRNERWLVPFDPAKEPIALPLLPNRVQTALVCKKQYFLNRIPEGTPPGEYWFRVKWVYMLNGNPIATFRWNWPDVRVEVGE